MFLVVLWQYSRVLTRKVYVLKLDYIASSPTLSGSNAQHVNTPTTTILPTTVSIFHSLHNIDHIIYVLQTSSYQNIVKLLTHTNIKQYLVIF